MEEQKSIREIAARVCREAFQQKSEELAEEITRRIQSELAATSPRPHPDPVKGLRDGAVRIAGSRTQTETLDTLLASAAIITPRCGLMILRGVQAGGWSCQGFTTLEVFKRTTLDCSRGIAAKVITTSTPAQTPASELDPNFTAKLGLSPEDSVLLLPVLLKERVAAVLVAVGREDEDLPRLELLLQVAHLALDLQVYRKHSPAAEPARPVPPAAPPITLPHAVEAPAPPAAAVEVAAQGEAEPTASEEEPKPVAAAATGEEPPPPAQPAESVPEARPALPVKVTTSAQHTPSHGVAVTTTVAPLPVAAPAPPAPPVEAAPVAASIANPELHEKAARFARLLVDEIKLYNQAKVLEGRTKKDLYSRLQEDIEKSRAAYNKRYGESVKETDYFTKELLRILADDNRELMGAGFPS